MRTTLIDDYLRQLKASVGSQPPIREEELKRLFDAKDYTGMVRWIRDQLRLNCRIRLGMVRAGGQSCPAWIMLPAEMPMFGTDAFKNFLVTMFLREDFVGKASFEQVVTAISHELSHILLDSLRHPLRRAEEAVDLTAMLLGYRDFYITAEGPYKETDIEAVVRETMDRLVKGYVTNQSQHLGYLSQSEIGYAATRLTQQ